MKKLLAVCLLAATINVYGQTPDFVKDSLDVYVERALRDWQIPGVSVCIVKDGKLVLAKGYGVRRMYTDEKVDEHSLFMIGSNTKAFTATALAMLETEGKMKLDDKVVKWWPEYKLYDPWVTKEVNMRDLLSHRLGYETFQGDFMFFDSDLTAAEIFEKFAKLKPYYDFRTRWGYCNAAFAAAGEITRRVTGKKWGDVIKEKLLQPLGMTRSGATVFDLRMASNIAFPHSIHDGKIAMVAFGQLDGMSPAGSISSSATDISKWMIAQLDSGRVDGKQVIPFRAIASTWQPHSIVGSTNPINPSGSAMYGLGWFLEEYKGHPIVSHTGGVNGYVTSVTLLPKEKLGIAVFTNTDQNYFYETLKWDLIDAYLGLPAGNYSGKFVEQKIMMDAGQAQRISVLRDSAKMKLKTALPLNAYARTYEHPIYGKMEVVAKPGGLEMHFEHHKGNIVTLESLGGHRFLGTWTDPLYGIRPYTFTVENGKPVYVSIRVSGFIENLPYEFVKKE